MTELMTALILMGTLSGYHQRPTDGTVNIRQEWGQLPEDLSQYDALVSVPDCGVIGWEGTMSIQGEELSVLAFDCAGQDSHWWMINNGIAAELDWYTWRAHPEWVGTEVTATLVLEPPGGDI